MAHLTKRGSNFYLVYRKSGKQVWERLLLDGQPVTSKAQAKILKTQRERELQILKTQKLVDAHEARQTFNQMVFGPALEQLERKAIEEQQLAITPADFFEEFRTWASEETANGPRRSKNTVLAYETAWNRFFKYLTLERLADLTPSQVNYVIKCWRKEDVTPKAIRYYLTACSAVLIKAMEWGRYLAENPFKKFQGEFEPRNEGDTPEYLTQEQVNTLLEKCEEQGTNVYLYAALLVHLGLRRSEALNLRWEEVDLERKSVTLRNHTANPNKGIQEFRLKNGKGRSVPIKQELQDILSQYAKPEGYVVEGKGRSKGADLKRFRGVLPGFTEACEAAGMPHVHSHLLRHTFASLAAQAGISIYKVQSWLGHGSEAITRIYAHIQAYDPDVEKF